MSLAPPERSPCRVMGLRARDTRQGWAKCPSSEVVAPVLLFTVDISLFRRGVTVNVRRIVPAVLAAAFLTAGLATPANAEPRIIGGENAKIEDSPWVVYISRRADGLANCGGVLVAPNKVLTSADCATFVNSQQQAVPIHKSRFTVTSGRSDLLDVAQDVAPGADWKVTDIWVHPQYQNEPRRHDFAILTIELDYADVDPVVTPIALAGPDDAALYEPGPGATIFGWGASFQYQDDVGEWQSEGANTQLRRSEVPVIAMADCVKSLPIAVPFRKQFVCAGDTAAKKTVCDGDFGGPLVRGGKLIGVASRAVPFDCGETIESPAQFANVRNDYDVLQAQLHAPAPEDG